MSLKDSIDQAREATKAASRSIGIPPKDEVQVGGRFFRIDRLGLHAYRAVEVPAERAVGDFTVTPARPIPATSSSPLDPADDQLLVDIAQQAVLSGRAN